MNIITVHHDTAPQVNGIIFFQSQKNSISFNMALEDYKDIVGAAAGLVTFCQMFSGVFLCRDIYNSGSTDNIAVTPFVGGLVISVLLYRHALLINDGAMTTVNLGGAGLNIAYLLFYFLWTQSKMRSKFYKELWKGIALTLFLLFYAQIEDPKKVEFRFGMIVTALLMCLIASPLFSLGEVIRTRSTKSLPFPMIISGSVVSLHWLLYGIIIRNSFVIFQNVVMFLLCIIQLSLFIIFPNKIKEKKVQ